MKHHAALIVALLSSVASAQPPYPDRHVYFGDLHLHSSYSADAFALGARLTPDDAYRYAEGLPVAFLGRTEKRRAPLDFLALTDHAEYLGVMPEAAKADGGFADTDWPAALNDKTPGAARKLFGRLVAMAAQNARLPEFEKPAVLTSLWQSYMAAADRHNRPGKFTALIGFEWSSAPGNQNLHRCVIFRDKGPAAPFSSLDAQDPERLWDYLERQRAAGLSVLAIPHNGNISNGLMFNVNRTYAGGPVTAAYAKRRMANEPLFEIIQEKGSSDTHPLLSPNDEFADFETYNMMLASTTTAKFKTGSYLRQAYGTGQEIAGRIGVNPFKYGIEAGTDSHSGMSSTEETNFAGRPDDADRKAAIAGAAFNQNPGGLTGVWADANTRAAIFDALARKETFATSGGRIKVRMFAGWDFPADMAKRTDWVAIAYRSGVPMGSDLGGYVARKRPHFAFQAVKDPDSAGLDRVQMVKVSTLNGKSREQIFDIAWSTGRRIDPQSGKLERVPSVVDLPTSNPISGNGAAELKGVWTDPAFEPHARATYYLRVLEVPTARWSTHWAASVGVKPPPGRASTVQERAWTSPIWFTPSHAGAG